MKSLQEVNIKGRKPSGSTKLFEKLYNTGRQMNTQTVKLSRDMAVGASTGVLGVSSERKGLTLKNRLNNMNNTYS